MKKKTADKTEHLSQVIRVRVSQEFGDKLNDWLSHSNCQSVSELVRRILYKEEIVWNQKDASKETIARELAGIRAELKAIGTNINQITRYFNSTDLPNQKIFHALKVQEEYNKVGRKVDQLVTDYAKHIKLWLQG